MTSAGDFICFSFAYAFNTARIMRSTLVQQQYLVCLVPANVLKVTLKTSVAPAPTGLYDCCHPLSNTHAVSADKCKSKESHAISRRAWWPKVRLNRVLHCEIGNARWRNQNYAWRTKVPIAGCNDRRAVASGSKFSAPDQQIGLDSPRRTGPDSLVSNS